MSDTTTNGMRGAQRGKMTSVPTGETHEGAWPRAMFRATQREYSLDLLLYYKEKRFERGNRDLLMGFAIPPFQRPVVWDEARMVRFVESAVLGLHLGTWLFNAADGEEGEGVDGFHRTHHWLLDGQQRLTALDRFFEDAFPVFGRRWSELPVVEQRRFLMTPFTAQEVNETNESVLREIYDRLNFGGVAHTADQSATMDAVIASQIPHVRIEWAVKEGEDVRFISIPHTRLIANGWDIEWTFHNMTGHDLASCHIRSFDLDTPYDIYGNILYQDDPEPTVAPAPTPIPAPKP